MGYENTSMDLKGFEFTAEEKVKCGDDCILIGKVFKHPQELHVCFPPCRPPSHIHFVITGQKHRDVINKCLLRYCLCVGNYFLYLVCICQRANDNSSSDFAFITCGEDHDHSTILPVICFFR